MQLTDKQKGIALAFLGVLMITPDSLFIRLVNIHSWDLVFYRGAIPFLCLLIGLYVECWTCISIFEFIFGCLDLYVYFWTYI